MTDTRLLEALRFQAGEMLALVGGGGKTSAMFRLAEQLAAGGASVITTTTTRIFAAQTRLAPVHVQSIDELARALVAHRHVLYTGVVDPVEGKAFGLPPEQIDELRDQFPGCSVLVEADGSRMRPFKAPAGHEPVIPSTTNLVCPVVGMDALGLPLSDKYVHRTELIAAIHPGAVVSVEMVADVLRHPSGGRKNVPPGAGTIALINKVDAQNLETARQLADRLAAPGGLDGALLCAVGHSDNILGAVYAKPPEIR